MNPNGCNRCQEEVCCCKEMFNLAAADLYDDLWRMFEALDSYREDRRAYSDALDEI